MVAEFKLRRGGKGGGRLHIGFRARDRTPVWYEPIPGPEDDDGGAMAALYAYANGEQDYRAPMDGEVKWYPPFDPANHASTSKAQRLILQKQTLKNAYDYALETDDQKLRDMEAKFDDPQFSRQYAWFCALRTWKKRDKKRRITTRKEREQLVRTAGEDPETCEINSDDSDSGYEEAYPVSAITAESRLKPKRKRPANRAESGARKSNKGRGTATSNHGRLSDEMRGAHGRVESIGEAQSLCDTDDLDWDSSPPEEHQDVQITSGPSGEVEEQLASAGNEAPVLAVSHQATVETDEEGQ